MDAKDIIVQEINKNSKYKHFLEYGEGRFIATDAIDIIAEELVKKLNLASVNNNEVLACVVCFRNKRVEGKMYCERCAKLPR